MRHDGDRKVRFDLVFQAYVGFVFFIYAFLVQGKTRRPIFGTPRNGVIDSADLLWIPVCGLWCLGNLFLCVKFML